MSGIDRISALPESLLVQILSYLPTKKSVKTSVLSKRWKKLWLNVLGFDLIYKDFRDDQVFFSFIDRFIEFKPESPLFKFKVISSDVEVDGLKERIGTAVSRGIRHLDVKGSKYRRDVEVPDPFIDSMPLNLYTSKTLVSLKLSRSGLQDCGFVSLPCLKFMHLRRVRWVGNMTLEKLISGCPVLEELTLLRDLDHELEGLGNEPVVTRVRSPSLKRFFVPRNGLFLYRCRLIYILEIDAPGLEYMSLKQDQYDRIVVKNLSSSCTVDLDIEFIIQLGMKFDPEDVSKKNEISDFLIGVSSVRHMIISQRTLKVLDRYSKVGTLPKFNNLSRLVAEIPRTSLQSLQALLESCLNLKHLILKVHGSEELGVVEVTSASGCYLSSLECVEMKEMFEWEEEEMKIASYFVENSAVLKKLILRFVDHTHPRRTASDSDIYNKLSQLTKRSQGCQIIIDYKYYK